MISLILAAQETGTVNALTRNYLLDLTSFYQCNKLLFKVRPLSLVLLVCLEHLLLWRKLWQVGVFVFVDVLRYPELAVWIPLAGVIVVLNYLGCKHWAFAAPALPTGGPG
jgi:hypothetical protein